MKTANDLNIENYQKLINLKETDGNGNLFKKIPPELVEFVKYTKSLKFEQKPDYSYLRSIFNNIIFKNNLTNKNLNLNFIKVDQRNKSLSNRTLTSFKSNFRNKIYNKIKENIETKSKTEDINKDINSINSKFNSSYQKFSSRNRVPNSSHAVILCNKMVDIIKDSNNTIETTKNIPNIKTNETIEITSYSIKKRKKYTNIIIKKNNLVNKDFHKKKNNINNINFIFNSNYLCNSPYINSYKDKEIGVIKDKILTSKSSLNADLYKNFFFSKDINYKSPLIKQIYHKQIYINNNNNNNKNVRNKPNNKIDIND